MKILFDANLSPALVTGLRVVFPGSTHVRDVNLRSAPDAQIWEYAKTHGFAIASKDLSPHRGFAVAEAQAHADRVSCRIVPRRIWMHRGVDGQSVGRAVGCWQFDVADCRGSGSGKWRSGADHRSGSRHGGRRAHRNGDDHTVGLARINSWTLTNRRELRSGRAAQQPLQPASGASRSS